MTLSPQAYTRHIAFSGFDWIVKVSNNKVGPGPNLFSDSTQSVWVDELGHLHMKIRKSGSRWTCSEVILNGTLGYGTYRWTLASRVDNLDPNVVLGLFTWSDPDPENHREIDIEMSKWGNRNNLNAQYVIQPYDVPGNTHRFSQPAVSTSNHSFRWQPGSVYCESLSGLDPTPNGSNVIQQKVFTSGIPTSSDENARINLWLFRGRAPKAEVEVVVSRFEFVP